jgi:HEAT repeat protein
LTIRPLDQKSEQTLIARLLDDTATDDDIALLVEQNTPAAVDAVLKRLAVQPYLLWRLSEFVRKSAPCDSWTWISALVGSSGNEIEQPLAREMVTAFGERCPAVVADLRRVVADRSQQPNARRHAAQLLGRFRRPEDVRLLIAALREPANIREEASARAGAVEGLADIGGNEATAALIEALEDPKRSLIHVELAAALGRAGSLDAVPALVRQLDSPDSYLVLRAIISLRQLGARSATPDLLRLLTHQNPTLRAYAASALQEIADGSIQEEMQTALSDRDETVQVAAMYYLAKHGDSSFAPVFESRAGATRQPIQEAARTGLHYLGTPSSVEKVRPFIEAENEAVRRSTVVALELLTFRTWAPSKGTDELRPKDFDAWWKADRARPRRAWAIEALQRSSTPDPVVWSPRRLEKIRALEYLGPTEGSDAHTGVHNTNAGSRLEHSHQSRAGLCAVRQNAPRGSSSVSSTGDTSRRV